MVSSVKVKLWKQWTQVDRVRVEVEVVEVVVAVLPWAATLDVQASSSSCSLAADA